MFIYSTTYYVKPTAWVIFKPLSRKHVKFSNKKIHVVEH